MISTRLIRQFVLWTITFSSISAIGKLKWFRYGFFPMACDKCDFLRGESQNSEFLLQFLLIENKSCEFTQSPVQWINVWYNFFHYLTISGRWFVTDLIMGISFGHYVPTTSPIHMNYRQYCVCERETAALCEMDLPFAILRNPFFICRTYVIDIILKRRTVDVCGRFLSPHCQRGCLSDTGFCL